MIRDKLRNFIEHKYVTNFILAVIVYNAIALGLLTYPQITKIFGQLLQISCFACVVIFTIEISIKLYVYGKNFFKDGWNNFDFILVAMSWIPTGGIFSSFRAFRILRTLRLVTRMQKLRVIVQAIIESVPNVGWASLLLLLIFYIFSIMGTTLFGETFYEYFGTIGKSMFTLFQVMTLEAWVDIARTIMEVQPLAWIYFLSFILVSSFIVMNVIVGVIVNAIGEISAKSKLMHERNNRKNMSETERELSKLKRQIAKVEALLNAEQDN